MTCKIFVVLHEVSRSSVHHLSLGLGGFSSSSRFLNNFLCLLQNTSSSYLSSSTLISIRLLSHTKILGQLCILLRWDMHFYFYCFLSLCCLIQNTSKSWLLDSYFPLFFLSYMKILPHLYILLRCPSCISIFTLSFLIISFVF